MRRLPALAAFLATAALANAPAAPDRLKVDVGLGAKKVHEECARLEAGESRRYEWRSSAPVDFNIHYHRGNDVLYPVRRDGMRGDGGTFTAKSAEDYCWMWTGRAPSTRVEGSIGK